MLYLKSCIWHIKSKNYFKDNDDSILYNDNNEVDEVDDKAINAWGHFKNEKKCSEMPEMAGTFGEYPQFHKRGEGVR